ncbi:ExeA family protein [Thiomicrorhabdus xiamenensis]|uniref:AAA family ATPase n=1 Tax=Thiomicrorhabdus xiamenensis TaxID=2739063 RepID=A0A7D4NQG1_9GAMM|nr:AAA family ATPase [Thiomicrorhabdus xiamenensis]QKI88650.1 AAA family ATPase [Thiomicrorhabdus xiamenensis]
MYRPYFGLSQLPFKTTPELEMFYNEGSREEILQALKYTVERGDGILKVVGEVGCGKTMILRLLANTLADNFKLIYVNSPNLSSKDILLFICTELGLEVTESSQKFTLINRLQNRLLELYAQGSRVVMLIDEAQAMTLDGLEEIRLLSNLETDSDKLLQIVLFGQPELDRALDNPNIRQLKSRITYSIYIPPFSVDDVLSYLNFRMRRSGYSGIDVFTKPVAKRIFDMTNGYPRGINVLADKLLMVVYSQQDRVAKTKHFKSLDSYENAQSSSFKMLYLSSAIFIVAALSVVYFFIYDNKPLFPGENVAASTEKSVIKDDIDKVEEVQNDYTGTQIAAKVESFEQPVKADEASLNNNEIQVQPKISEKPEIQLVSENNAIEKEFVTPIDFDSYYEASKLWVDSLEGKGYTIQLATIAFSSLPKFKSDIQRSGLSPDSVNYVLDYKVEDSVFRIKVYYSEVVSYDEAKRKYQALPKRFLSSKPFITSFSVVRKSLDQAVKYLNNGGGSDVS